MKRPIIGATPRTTRLLLIALLSTGVIGWTGAEAWVPPAIAFTFDAGSGVVTINGTVGNDVSTAAWETRNTLRVTRGTLSATYSSVKGIVFNGYDGNDSFTNSTTLPSVIDGGDGDDILTGGGGDDFILGGKGQDTIYGKEGNDTMIGSAGSDTMSGGGGNDLMKGESGMDLVYGDEGDDRLYGGPDSDWIHGDLGQDLIVSIGGSADTIAGGSQTDNFWVDAIDVVTDAAAGEQSLGYLHEVEALLRRQLQRGQPVDAHRQGARRSRSPGPASVRQPHGPLASELRQFPAVRGRRPDQRRLLPGQRRRLLSPGAAVGGRGRASGLRAPAGG